MFKTKGITVSGGATSLRHALSSQEIILSQFITLLNIMENYYINKKGEILHRELTDKYGEITLKIITKKFIRLLPCVIEMKDLKKLWLLLLMLLIIN